MPENGLSARWEHWLETKFAACGRLVARRPWTIAIASLLVTVACASGFAKLQNETRPEKQWVVEDAKALTQNDFVKETWPSSLRLNMWIATCKDEAACDITDAAHTQRLFAVHERIMALEVDGDAIAATLDEANPEEAGDGAPWAKYKGTWKYKSGPPDHWMCFKTGPFCLERSVLNVYRDDKPVVDALTNAAAVDALNFWEDQAQFCPVSIAREDSPCRDASKWNPENATTDALKGACQTYTTATEKKVCREASAHYCKHVCPTRCRAGTGVGGVTCVPEAVDSATCKDNGCLTLQTFGGLAGGGGGGAGDGDGEAPDSAFAFEPFKIKTVASAGAGGPATDAAGKYTTANAALFGYFGVTNSEIVVKGDASDPLAEQWENLTLCELGVDVGWAKGKAPEGRCPEDDLLDFKPNFARSLGDEFGSAIRGDIGKLGGAYMVILAYMVVMLSRCDPVHSMGGMSFVTVLVVGMSYACAMGLGGYAGIFNNNLNQNIPFLLLGLGVDDAFVLTSCYRRARRREPGAPTARHIEEACRTGGISILITSVTDALAFFVGAATRLPALSWFCQFAGLGVTFCFLFQLFFFLPCLAINARRAEANRLDVLCCVKAPGEGKHRVDRPEGCCCCAARGVDKDGRYVDGLADGLTRFARWAVSRTGRMVTLGVFAVLFGLGVGGCTKMYKDFKLEWFIPSDSYVNNFFTLNEEYFSTGTKVDVHTKGIDYYASRAQLDGLHTYLKGSKYVDQAEGVTSWYEEFKGATGTFDDSSAANFYAGLREWYAGGAGARYRSSIRWASAACEDTSATEASTVPSGCDTAKGLTASKLSATLKLEFTDKGSSRYETMTTMRDEIDAIVPPDADGKSNAFPFSFEFLYWEENGVIDVELTRNLGICAAVVLAIIFLMIPHPKIAAWVALCVILSVMDLVGFLYWWGVTISGTSTIYILISVGLAVDYSAHIAHAFTTASGNAPTRAVKAMRRLGPSVFNAVVSTGLAVALIGFSKSWVFARRSSAEHLIATKALRCTATAWILTVAESFAKF